MSLFHASTCIEHHVLIVRRPKLYYTVSGIITRIGGRLVHGTAKCIKLVNIKINILRCTVSKMSKFTIYLLPLFLYPFQDFHCVCNL